MEKTGVRRLRFVLAFWGILLIWRVTECDCRHVGRQTTYGNREGKNVGEVSKSQQVLEHVILLPSADSLVARRGCAGNRVR